MKTMTTEQFKQLHESGESVTVINALSADAYEEKHIPGSENIPLEDADFVSKVEQAAGGKDAKVVVYCASTECPVSADAAKKLEAAGFTNVIDFEGGTQSWEEAGNEVASGAIH